ncbi:MAG: UDP-N-acetylglucosamine--N-acetylmuramyl-(pentapeptide) pyrophosphoryl-undecaprenol N-acetylglucosamine transferase [bacterium]
MARIGIACGGTGGHLFPGLALAEEFERLGHHVRLYISEKPVDAEVMKSYPQFESVSLPVIGWAGMIHSPFFLLRFILAYRQCLGEMKVFEPHAMIGMGGFLSAPPLLAALKQSIPAYLHESNSIPGRVTRWFAPRMTRVFLGFEECARHLPSAPVLATGTPVRQSLKKMSKESAAKMLSVETGKTLVVMGGSQGARSLNTLVLQAAPLLGHDWKKWQVIHLAGMNDVERVENAYRELDIKAKVLPFCDEMEAVYSLADLVVARSGAASLSEIAHYALPSLLVPYPNAVDDHQAKNAEIFMWRSAARCLDERIASAKQFARELHSLMQDEAARRRMTEQVKSVFPEDTTSRIVKEVSYAFA